MLDKVNYWLELCDDDLRAAKNLHASNDYLWMGFICHLIAEKALKAIMANTTDEVPKTHHLLKLAVMANVNDDLSESQKNLLGKLMPLQIEARYPEHKARIASTLTNDYCANLLKETEEFLCWIKARLEK